jgi:polyribonucleotide nucleotidyltransferase
MNTQKVSTFETDFNGTKISFETGKMGLLTDGAVVVKYNDSVLLATVVIKKEIDESKDYFPLSVEFQDKWYATGKISGSRFIKREGRPSEMSVLRSRMIDRPIRPMFPRGFMYDTQLIVTPLSFDYSIDPAVLGLAAASGAMMLTGAPFEGPLGAVRIGRIDGKLVVNPSEEEMSGSDLDLLVAGTSEAITMIEGGAKQVPEDVMVEALELAHKAMQPVIELQNKMVKELKVEPMEYSLVKAKEDTFEAVADYPLGLIVANFVQFYLYV